MLHASLAYCSLARTKQDNESILALLEHDRLKKERSNETPLPPKPSAEPVRKPTSKPPQDASFMKQQLADTDTIPEDIPVKSHIGKAKLMNPNGRFADHDAIPLLRSYADNGCPVNCGPDWTEEHILAALKRGPHISAKDPRAIEALRTETTDKVANGFSKVVKWRDIKDDIPPQLKISPIAMIPHKSRAFRAILDLSFTLRHKGQVYESVNATTVKQAPFQAMVQLGQTLRRLICTLATHYDPDKPFMFSKIDIKDGFWRVTVSKKDA